MTYVSLEARVVLRRKSWKAGGEKWSLDRVLRVGELFSNEWYVEGCFRQKGQHLQREREVELWVKDKYAPLNIARVVCRGEVELSEIYKASSIILKCKFGQFLGEFRRLHPRLPWWLSGKESACQCRRRCQSLGWEDPACCGAAELLHHSYWTCTLEPGGCNCWTDFPQLQKPLCLEPRLHNRTNHCLLIN